MVTGIEEISGINVEPISPESVGGLLHCCILCIYVVGCPFDYGYYLVPNSFSFVALRIVSNFNNHRCYRGAIPWKHLHIINILYH